MLSGFNNNFRYRGVLFHVQTEDSGISNPHVITHLFHGGNILASEKLDYSDKLGAADLERVVRELMETQHKAMLKRLQRGLHDTVILERLGPEVFSQNASSDRSDTDEAELCPDESETDTSARLVPPAPATAPPARPAARAAQPAAGASERLDRAFGEGVVSQKPLDEVVLEYLVENARKRKRRGS
jgi:hypothetical protein